MAGALLLVYGRCWGCREVQQQEASCQHFCINRAAAFCWRSPWKNSTDLFKLKRERQMGALLKSTPWPHGLMWSASDICSCASWKHARSTSGATCSLCHPGFSEHLSKHPESLVIVPCFRASYFRIIPQNMPNVPAEGDHLRRAQRWSHAQRKHWLEWNSSLWIMSALEDILCLSVDFCTLLAQRSPSLP